MSGGASSSAAALSRKSRWESSAMAITNINNRPPGSKPTDPKTNRPISVSNPSPKPKIAPSPKPNASALRPKAAAPFPLPFLELRPPPPQPPTYDFHMLDRRTIVLADGSVRSYFALPPDYQDFPRPPHLPLGPPIRDLPVGPAGPGFPPMSPEGLGPGFRDLNHNQTQIQNNAMKRKFFSEGEFNKFTGELSVGTSSPFGRNLNQDLRPGKHMRIGDRVAVINNNNKHLEVDQNKLKKAFLHFAKVINETESERKRYLEDGKLGRLRCVACSRSSKDFPNTHALILHAYNSDNADSRVDHLGLHKALCVLMGWNYLKPPDNSKAYQHLPADEAAANQHDLIMWPPMVIVHNTFTGKGKDGRMEGLGNRAMDGKIRDLGFAGGKSKSLYARDGHLGITLVKFSDDQSGLQEAARMAEYFEKDNHGRRAWESIQPVTFGKDDEKNPYLVKVDWNDGKQRILYGYLLTAADLCKVDFETRKKVRIESQRDYKVSQVVS